MSECHIQAILPRATRLSLDILLRVRSLRFLLPDSILILVAFLPWEEVPTQQRQVVATPELEATLLLVAIQPPDATLAPHSQEGPHPMLEAKDMEPRQGEQAILATHSPSEGSQHRAPYLVAFPEDRCLLSILEVKLLTLLSLPP